MKQIIGLILLLVILGIVIIWAKGKTPSMSGNTIFNIVTPSPVISPTPSSVSSSGKMTYTSSKLGISFDYSNTSNDVPVNIKEVGNKIYVYTANVQPESGQYLETFTKDKTVSLIDALKTKFITSKNASSCQVVTENSQNNYPSSFQIANLKVNSKTQDYATIMSLLNKCPSPYTASNGISYFLADSNHPDKYIFLSIGQYGIYAAPNVLWNHTIRFL